MTDAHYDSVGAALLWTLEQGLGDAWTAEVKAAWAAAYALLAGVMRDAGLMPCSPGSCAMQQMQPMTRLRQPSVRSPEPLS